MPYLRTLGELSLWASRDATEPLLADSKALLIVAVLATRLKRIATREYLAQLLWPDSDRSRARRSLRQALFYLSKHGSGELLVCDEANQHVAVNTEVLTVDLWEFDAALESEDFERAVTLYAGPFLEGCHDRAGPELEHWIEGENSRIQVGLEVAYAKLIADALARNDFQTAVRHAGAYAEMNPLDERAQSILVHALKAAGDELGALRAFQRYGTLIKGALGEEPFDELEESIQELRGGLLRETLAAAEPRAVAVAAGAGADAEENGARGKSGRSAAASPPAEPTVSGAGRRSLLRSIGAVARKGWTTATMLGLAVLVVSLTGVWVKSARSLRPSGLTAGSGLALAVVGENGASPLLELRFGGAEAELVATNLSAWDLASPDGSLIAYRVRAPDGWNLALRESDRDSGTVITRDVGDEYAEAWSPDGRFLVYRHGALAPRGRRYVERLYVYEVETHTARPLSEQAGEGHRVSAAWSPDGTRIAFAGEVLRQPDVFVVDFAGNDLRNLSDHPDLDGDPSWAPGGEFIAFVSSRTASSEVYLIRPDGSDLRQLTSTNGEARSPVWISPGVVGFVLEANGRADAWAVDIATDEIRQLTSRGDLVALRPAPDPTGRWIERIEIRPRPQLSSPGQHLEFSAVLRLASGDSVTGGAIPITWTVDPPRVGSLSGPGSVEVRDTGSLLVTATVGDWRSDWLTIASRPLQRLVLEPAFTEDWSSGLRPERWWPFGEPLPTVYEGAGPNGQGAFANEGDEHFGSGVVSRETFALNEGLSVEAAGRLAFTGTPFQVFAIALYPGLDPEATDWLGVPPVLEFAVRGPAGPDTAAAAWVATRHQRAAVPVPDRVSDWRTYVLEVSPDGGVSVIIDGVLHWRSTWRLDLTRAGPVRIGLGHQSFSTRILHGGMQVYKGPLYRLIQ